MTGCPTIATAVNIDRNSVRREPPLLQVRSRARAVDTSNIRMLTGYSAAKSVSGAAWGPSAGNPLTREKSAGLAAGKKKLPAPTV